MRHVCLFAQHDPEGALPDATRLYLAGLVSCGFELHLIRNGGGVPLALPGITIHDRPNRGLDFGAWTSLMQAGVTQGADTVLLANDSVLGPFTDLRPTIDRMRATGAELWGMIASRERVWHLQSWFIELSAQALSTQAIARVFAQDFDAMGKDEVILHGELGLGVAIREAGLRWAEVREEPPRHGLGRLLPSNPMHRDWRTILREGRVPFLKTELVRDNPLRVPGLGDWPALVSRRYGVDTAPYVAAVRRRAALAGERGGLKPALLHLLLSEAPLGELTACLRSAW